MIYCVQISKNKIIHTNIQLACSSLVRCQKYVNIRFPITTYTYIKNKTHTKNTPQNLYILK
jgi:hypothetical protein